MKPNGKWRRRIKAMHSHSFSGATAMVILITVVVACGFSASKPPLVMFQTPTPTHPPHLNSTAVPTPTATLASPSTPTATPIPGPTLTPTEGPPPEGHLRIVSPQAAPHLDVHYSVSEALASLGPGLAYSRLLRFTRGPDASLPTMQVECDLCERWRLVDPQTYQFELRRNARWQDVFPVNGRLVTANDVVFSLRRLGAENAPASGLLAGVTAISAVDDWTVQVELQGADVDLPRRLANGHAKVVAPEAVEVNGDLKEGPVIGTGPWKWQVDSNASSPEFLANPNYYEPGLPGMERLSIEVIPDGQTRLTVLQVGRADIAHVSPSQWNTLKMQGFRSILAPRIGTGALVALNTSRQPFDNPQARRAFFLGHDPWELSQKAWQDQAQVGVGVPVVSPAGLLERAELEAFFAKPEAARRAITALVGEEGMGVELLVVNYGPTYRRFGDLLARQVEEVGFQVSSRVLDVNEYTERVWVQRDFQVLVGALPPVSTTNSFLFSFVHSNGRWNIMGFSSRALDFQIEAQATDVNMNSRDQKIRGIQRRLLEEAVFYMPGITMERWAFGPRVTGFSPNFAGSEYFHWAVVRQALRR